MNFTGTLNAVQWKPTPVPMGGDSAFLWNKPQYCGAPQLPGINLQHELDMAARLAEQYGKDRMYRHDWIQDPCFGKEPAVAQPPQIPQTSQLPADYSMTDMPLHTPVADPLYREKLFVEPFFVQTPIISNQQIHGNFSVNTFG